MVELEQNEIDVAVVDLDAEQNRWLAELIDRKTLFQQRWNVNDSTVIDDVVEKAMAARRRWQRFPKRQPTEEEVKVK